MPFAGTVNIKEGQNFQFDVRGYDQFNNPTYVNPTWLSDPILGPPVDQNGLLYTLDGNGFGIVNVMLGGITGTQWINVQQRSWVQKGGNLNSIVYASFYPRMAFSGATPYVTWQESPASPYIYQIYVRHWNGATWVQDGGSLNVNTAQHAQVPSIAFNGVTPYVTWQEVSSPTINQIYVKHWNGAAWIQDGGSLNADVSKDAISPDIVFNGTTPYVTWHEMNGAGIYQVYVKHWNGVSWVQDGGSLNVDLTKSAGASKIVFNGTIPYVSWIEFNASGVSQIYVKHWNGVSWVQDGGSLNIDPAQNAGQTIASGVLPPGISINGTIPYVTWFEVNASGVTQIYVKHWNGVSWIQNGGSLNMDFSKSAYNSRIAFYGITPYVTWYESNAAGNNQLYVKHWNGVSWVQDGASLT